MESIERSAIFCLKLCRFTTGATNGHAARVGLVFEVPVIDLAEIGWGFAHSKRSTFYRRRFHFITSELPFLGAVIAPFH